MLGVLFARMLDDRIHVLPRGLADVRRYQIQELRANELLARFLSRSGSRHR